MKRIFLWSVLVVVIALAITQKIWIPVAVNEFYNIKLGSSIHSNPAPVHPVQKPTETVVATSTQAESSTTDCKDESSYGLDGSATSESHLSPDGKYIAVSASDEQGGSEISITDTQGNRIAGGYCGFYYSWATSSDKIKVLLPSECGYGGPNDEEYYYLDIQNKRTAVEGSTFVPTCQ